MPKNKEKTFGGQYSPVNHIMSPRIYVDCASKFITFDGVQEVGVPLNRSNGLTVSPSLRWNGPYAT